MRCGLPLLSFLLSWNDSHVCAKTTSGGVYAFFCVRVAWFINSNSLGGLVFHSRHIGNYWWLRVRKFRKRQDIGSLLQDFACSCAGFQWTCVQILKLACFMFQKQFFLPRFPPFFTLFSFFLSGDRWIFFVRWPLEFFFHTTAFFRFLSASVFSFFLSLVSRFCLIISALQWHFS